MIVAPGFSPGDQSKIERVAERRLNRQASLRDATHPAKFPRVETRGYSRMSLRDNLTGWLVSRLKRVRSEA